jgi:hypothetical protein
MPLLPHWFLPDSFEVLTVFLLLVNLHLAGAATIIHLFAHPSCNAGTAIGAPFTGDAAGAEICQVAPNGTVALYVDGINEGCTG